MSLAPILGHSPELEALRLKVERYVDEVAIPLETPDLGYDVQAHDERAVVLRAKAREAGIYLPQLPVSHGGLGLNWKERAVILEEAGRSALAPIGMNCAPPDQPNMINLIDLGTPAQKARYLEPLMAGQVRSCFAMTEPHPGAGSDPSMLRTFARRRSGGWVIDGHKWFASGAVGAAFAIVLAQTEEGATLFLVDADNPGYRFKRDVRSMDGFGGGGHGELVFESCEVADDAVLGEVGKGFAYAQMRLEPARISHCMRFIGRTGRALQIAQDYVNRRSSFGNPLSELQQIQAMVADSHIEMHACRLMVWHVAAKMDLGESVKHESAMTKVFVSEALYRIADRAAQMMGALGMSEDAPVSRILRELRPFRIYDGASELHRATIARRVLRSGQRP